MSAGEVTIGVRGADFSGTWVDMELDPEAVSRRIRVKWHVSMRGCCWRKVEVGVRDINPQTTLSLP